VTAIAVRTRAPRSIALSPRVEALLLRVAAGVVLLGLWEGLVTWFSPYYVTRPSGIAKVFWEVVSNRPTPLTQLSGSFWFDVQTTVVAVFEGLAIGVVAGIVVGLAMGRLRDVEWALRYYIGALFAMPTIAILPLMTLWFGYTNTARLWIVILGAFLPVALNVYDGVRKLPTTYLEVARTYHAPWWNVWFGIALPASLPYLLAGLRLAAGRALVAAVVAEYLLAVKGLGFFIRSDTQSLHENQAMVGVIMLALIGVGINAAIDAATKRFLPWYRREGA
jgi:ABC-type nitrate/sulfonate/bicarbonate transport system permease component